ncbi:MAG TPA: bifunctional DNA primase/polymerase [Candidatus Tumulicola sp.]
MLDGALEYARRGWYVFPVHGIRNESCTCGAAGCVSPGKHPHVKGWPVIATTDRQTIAQWWRQWPEANIGVACGPSGLLVLDIDPRHGGDKSLEWLEELHRHFYNLKAKTGGGGFHLFFKKPATATVRSRANALGNGYRGIDIRADGGFIVLPPSLHVSGKRYEWDEQGSVILSASEIPAAPPWLIDLLQEPAPVRSRAKGSVVISVGQRNHAAFETACTLLRQDLAEDTVVDELRGMRDRGTFENPVDDPFTDDEIWKCAASAALAVSKHAPTDKWRRVRPWPTLDAAALYGLAGDLVRAIELETEGDPAALLVTLLVGFGNAIGPTAHARVHGDLHPARLFAAVVGKTSTGGKGTSLATIKPFLRAAYPEWFEGCRKAGFGSGEALIAELSGAHRAKDDTNPIEKRAFVIEPEFARLLTINARDGSTLSPILRSAWDDGRLEFRLSKARMIATDAHVSLVAHITPEELREKLRSTDVCSGFANRVLFVLAQRTRKLPSGGNIPPELVAAFGDRLREAMQFARGAGLMERTPEAEALWAQLYIAEPDREGIVGAVCDRWQAQKLRLSVVYALLDRSTVIRPDHVLAAEAFWRYCVSSAGWIWGSSTGEDIADRLLERLRAAHPGGISRDDARGLFGRHISSNRLTAAIDDLRRRGQARIEKRLTGGRSREVLYAIPCAESAKSAETTLPEEVSAHNALTARDDVPLST